MKTIIGVDCSATRGLTGLALTSFDGKCLHVQATACDSRDRPSATIVHEWLLAHRNALLAFDAPLGWPSGLRAALLQHQAGMPIQPEAHSLFRRLTDDAIHRRLKKRPLDVGADRIARTAHAALALLATIRNISGFAIPLAWDRESLAETKIIEVYPAATRKAHKIQPGAGNLNGISPSFLRAEFNLQDRSSHERDAVICAMAGVDFIRGDSVSPTDAERDTAVREGWIWARRLDV